MYIRYYSSFSNFLLSKCENDVKSVKSVNVNKLVEKDKYEGGLVEWEALGLLKQYLVGCTDFLSDLYSVILDLGCGVGTLESEIAQIRSQHNLKTTIIMQDYNTEVYDLLTQNPNFNSEHVDVHFIHCSWNQMSLCLSQQTNIISLKELNISIVLSAETLYRCENFQDFSVILVALYFMDGKHELPIYLAQKRYYFGLAGGLVPFIKFLTLNQPRIKVNIVKSIENGINNIIDICRIVKAVK